MTFVSFASGSSGNCYLLTEGRAAVLLDTGISLRRIKTGLARRALTPDDLSAVLITHEHSDHVAGLPMLLKYYKNVKVYAPQTVAHALERAAAGLALLNEYDGKIKKLLTGIFGAENDFDAILGGVNLAGVGANGKRVVQNLLEALTPILREGAERRLTAAADAAAARADAARAERGAV